jgi:hypothetical protein
LGIKESWLYIAGGVATVVVILIVFSPQIVAMTTITPERCYEIYSQQEWKIQNERGFLVVGDPRNYVDSHCNLIVYSDYYNSSGQLKTNSPPPPRDDDRMHQIVQVGMQKGMQLLKWLQ